MMPLSAAVQAKKSKEGWTGGHEFDSESSPYQGGGEVSNRTSQTSILSSAVARFDVEAT
jgi:hypothetical protein